MEKTYNVSKVTKKIEVLIKTLQRGDMNGKLIASRTYSNRRYYTDNQSKDIKEDISNIKNMIETIKNKYENMKKCKMSLNNANIIGHIVYPFCTMQNTDKIDFFDSYDNITMNGVHICTCDIIIDDKSSVSIITSPIKARNNNSIKRLYNYMKKTGASRGIVIKGTVWTLVDSDGMEYSIDFNDTVSEKEFEKFLIQR